MFNEISVRQAGIGSLVNTSKLNDFVIIGFWIKAKPDMTYGGIIITMERNRKWGDI